MSRRTTMVAVAVAAAVGLLLWWLASARDEPAEGRGGGVAAVREAPDGGVAATATRRGPRPVPAADRDPAGALRLEGQVIDAAQRPVAGATVQVSSYPARTVTTEADGSFVFEGLLPRSYHVSAQHGADRSEMVVVRLRDGVEPLILRLHPGITVAVTVIDAATRAPVAGAMVVGGGWIERIAISGADGVAEVTGLGSWFNHLTVEADGYAPTSLSLTLPDDPGGRHQRTVELGRGAMVSGTVLDPAGAPVAGAAVQAEADDGSAALQTDADPAGRWSMPVVGAGTYTFSAKADGLPPVHAEPIALDGVTGRDGVVLRLVTGGRASGFVVDAQGVPVPHAEVVAVAGGLEARTSAGADGRFELRGLARGAHKVVARQDDRSSPIVDVDVGAGDVADLELIVVDATIAGVVVGPDGEPIAEASVSAMPVSDHVSGLTSALHDVTDSSGRFAIGPVPGGRYGLTAEWPDTPPDNAYLRSHQPAEAEGGDREVRLVLPPSGSIAGTVVLDGAPVTWFGVSVNDFEAGLMSFSTPQPARSATGRFERRAVPPGTWMVGIAGEGFATVVRRDVVVEPGKVADLGQIEVERGAVARGRVIDSSGTPVAGATVLVAPFFNIFDGGLGLDDDPLKNAMTSHRSAVTGGDGRFEIAGLRGDRKRPMRAFADRPGVGRSRERDVPASPGELELVLTAVGELVGAIRGAPVGDRLMIDVDAVAGDSGATAHADDAGRFRIRNLPVGAYRVRAIQMPDLGTPAVEVEVRAGEPVRVEVVFDPTTATSTRGR